jgi:hypothetical protein
MRVCHSKKRDIISALYGSKSILERGIISEKYIVEDRKIVFLLANLCFRAIT